MALWGWIWTGWLLSLIASFAVLEGWAIAHGGVTLSQFTATVSRAWPLLPWVCGLIVGGLAVHFWWQWTPAVGLIYRSYGRPLCGGEN